MYLLNKRDDEFNYHVPTQRDRRPRDYDFILFLFVVVFLLRRPKPGVVWDSHVFAYSLKKPLNSTSQRVRTEHSCMLMSGLR
jgi:hypothetical protein